MAYREPNASEQRLLAVLGRRSSKVLADEWMDGLLVEDMADGGMNSIRLKLRGQTQTETFGGEIAVCQFKDIDDTDVIATLYADEEGVPFELDVWKVDFSPLKQVPERLE